MRTTEEIRAYNREYERSGKRSQKSLERRRLYDKERIKRPERKAYAKKLAERNREKTNQKRRERLKRYRLEVIEHYSGGNGCACCGEKNFEFMAIDHIRGDGAVHRRVYTKKYKSIADFLVKNNFPDGFQILCHNCNMAKGFYGYCPHTAVIKD